MEVTLGGDRLGSGNKNKIYLHNFERSTHNLSRTWKSSMTVGTLVPFFQEIGLNGDTFDLDLRTMVHTIPTIGPLFGSFKLQLDIFECPMRLYNGALHNNALGIGMNMQQIKIPKMELVTRSSRNMNRHRPFSIRQISPSSLISYLGVKGIAYNNTESVQTVGREFNAIPVMAYYDIFKNYYSNKQETNAYVIGHVAAQSEDAVINYVACDLLNNDGMWVGGKKIFKKEEPITLDYQTFNLNGRHVVNYYFYGEGLNADNIFINGARLDSMGIVYEREGVVVLKPHEGLHDVINYGDISITGKSGNISTQIQLIPFPLENIDKMREDCLFTRKEETFYLNSCKYEPFNTATGVNEFGINNNYAPLNGLVVKTYQSDIFNAWVDTDYIENPVTGITARTAVAVDANTNSFTIDSLNMATKMYDMLNRVAVSDGSYEAWQEANWGEDAIRRAETPIYCGGYSAEIVFEEVVATTKNEDQELGNLGGKGKVVNEKTNHIVIHVKEPTLIMGIVSITPRVDYSQGNKWFMTNLDNFDNLHKPILDGIGFENLMAEQMAWFDRRWQQNPMTGEWNLSNPNVAGKIPAWSNYMTSYDEIHGDFADKYKAGWMVLSRDYEVNPKTGGIKDLTTYIDPEKFNYAFADASIEAQNFWLQIGTNVEARRKMSAKQIPNL